MPKRVTDEHRKKQDAIAKKYAAARGLHLELAPGGTFSPVDFVLRESASYGARPAEVLEVKCRNYTSTAFQTIWLEERKAANLRRWAHVFDCPGIFLVEWSDGVLRWIDVDDAVAAAGGQPVVRRRTDRDDAADTDLVYEVPISSMRGLTALTM